jgi:hypothetical protein
MGIEAVLTVVPKTEFRKRPRRPDLPRFDLHKEWSGLRLALEEIGRPASLALSGNDGEGENDDSDFELIIVTPALAKKIDKALQAKRDDELLALIDERRKSWGGRLRKSEHKYQLAAFEIVKAAYRLAASTDAYVEVFIG